MLELPKSYDPLAVEGKWYQRWLEMQAFHTDSSRGGNPYCIVIPPPNITGVLHMGHALNVTIQDILIRWQRMQGSNALWIPGTDHAGIATQNVVEKTLRREGKTRQDLGRDAFLKRVWEWREQYGSTIIQQLKKLGMACDWDRERFTMDEGLSNAVTEVFVRLYQKDLIYKGNYIINWCPRCGTALSDEESEHVETNGHLYYLRYPAKSGRKKDAVVVATTRPETLLGDVALAVNPRDERYRHLVGRHFLLPILKRDLSIIEDDFVDPELGTGVVKVTPAHDQNDFEMGRRHGLQPINVMNEDGTMNEKAGPYRGMDRFECRRKIMEELTSAGLVDKIEDHVHAVGHCYRCHTVVEPRLSLQWFVKMKPLARPAIEAVQSGEIQLIPERWTKVYLDWMENIHDWCISRQIWWGHRIPVFYCDACNNQWARKGQPSTCPSCGSDRIRQDEDVLDTWFSSWLWPFSTLGWPDLNKDLKFYYPTNSLVTASEIIFFWVARMIMAGLEFMGEVPFRKVFIHGTIRDETGRKMSKSLGNSIDPLDIIENFSADALRFSLMMVTPMGQDVFLSNENFEVGRNFLTKLWNAARFMQINTGDIEIGIGKIDFDPKLLSPDDKHILSCLNDAIAFCDENLERFRFNDVARQLYKFVWHEYCDWYIEYAKITLTDCEPERRKHVIAVMHYVFSNALRLLHPLVPFITEELWHVMNYGAEADTILGAQWPQVVESSESDDETGQLVKYVDDKHDLIRIGRTLRTDYGFAPSRKLKYIVKPESPEIEKLLKSDRATTASFLKAESLLVDPNFNPEKAMPHGVSKLGMIFMPIEGVIDIEKESRRLSEQLDKTNGAITAVNRKLNNFDFIRKAPPEVVEIQKERKQALLDKCEKLNRMITVLSSACDK